MECESPKHAFFYAAMGGFRGYLIGFITVVQQNKTLKKKKTLTKTSATSSKNKRAAAHNGFWGRLLPESMQAYIARRIHDAGALAQMGFGAVLLASVLTYDAADPSAHTAVNIEAGQTQAVQNILGVKGAYLADYAMQSFGLGAILAGVICCLWGYKTFRRIPQQAFVYRFIWMGFAACFAAIAFARVPAFFLTLDNLYLGGGVGQVGLNMIAKPIGSVTSNVMGGVLAGWEYTFSACIAGFVALCLALYSLTIPLRYAAYVVMRFVMRSAIFTWALIKSSWLISRYFISWVARHNQSGTRGDSFDGDMADQAVSSHATTGAVMADLFGTMRDIIAVQFDAFRRYSANQDNGAMPQAAPAKPIKAEKKAAPTAPAPSSAPAADAVPEKSPVSAGPNAPIQIPVVKSNPASQKKERQRALSLDANGEGGSDWELPPLDFLQPVPDNFQSTAPDDAGLQRNAEMLQSVLTDFNVSGDIVKIRPGPVVTLYEFEPAPGVKSSRVINLSDDIARSMAALSVRVAVIPGRNVIGIELPNKTRQTVYLRELLDTQEYEQNKAKLPLILGKDIGGQPIIADLARMPHLLVAGTTGSGKSVAVNTMLMSLLYRLSPEQCRMIMIDPKMLELSVYDDIPHLLSPVVTEPGKAVVALKWTVQEMENRYRSMSKLGVRNIEGYNVRLAEAREKGETLIRKVQTGYDPDTGKPVFEDQPMDLTSLPYIVVVVDEFADLMLVAGKDVENAIQRLAQMARAAGIHIIMATQRPSVDVITGVVKANFPTRISFHVTSKIDSRTIIGEGGAEQLLGMGDMLFMSPGGKLKRVHGPFVADQEVEDVVAFLRSQGEPSYLEDITDGENGGFGDSDVMSAMFGGGDSSDNSDELYDQAVAIVARERKASTSFIQRHLQIGYNRAARIIEDMEKQGVIGPANHVGKREVLISDFSEV